MIYCVVLARSPGTRPEEGYSTFESALASLGAVFAMRREAEAAKLLASLSQQAADAARASLTAWTGGLRTDTVSLDSNTKLSVLAVSS